MRRWRSVSASARLRSQSPFQGLRRYFYIEGLRSLRPHRHKQQQKRDQELSGEPQEDATTKTADALFATATGGQHLTLEGRQKGGPVVHPGDVISSRLSIRIPGCNPRTNG